MRNEAGISRRGMLGAAAGLAGASVLSRTALANESVPASAGPLKGRIRQSACKWCYRKMSVEALAAHGKQMGLVAIDLLSPDQFGALKESGLMCSMVNSHPINPGLNRKENWGMCLGKMRESIEATSAMGWPNVICFSGNRAGMSDEEGLKNCTEALKQIVGLAEQKKVTLHMELLNSKLNHKDYMCDSPEWGVELCKAVGSERFKLLYDIYHMQVQEGDVIATIRKHHAYFGHYHTAGVPGRNELDENQELQYPAIMRAILDTGFKGFVAQEFVPRGDPMKSLEQAVRICDV